MPSDMAIRASQLPWPSSSSVAMGPFVRLLSRNPPAAPAAPEPKADVRARSLPFLPFLLPLGWFLGAPRGPQTAPGGSSNSCLHACLRLCLYVSQSLCLCVSVHVSVSLCLCLCVSALFSTETGIATATRGPRAGTMSPPVVTHRDLRRDPPTLVF